LLFEYYKDHGDGGCGNDNGDVIRVMIIMMIALVL